MNPSRRDFIRLLLSTPIAATIDVEKLLWTPGKAIFLPSPRQIEFYGGAAGGGKSDMFFYGLPYHWDNGFNVTRGYYGMSRDFKLVKE